MRRHQKFLPALRPLALTLLCAALLIGTARAADPDAELIRITMHNAELTAYIQWIAEQTGKKIVVDPRVKGKISVLANSPITVEQAYQLFLHTLDIHGFAAAEQGGILRIFPAAMSRSAPTKLLSSYPIPESAEQLIYLLRVERVAASALVKLLQPLLPSNGYIAAMPDGNSLLIADEAANVKRLVELASRLDQHADLDITSTKLQHASAKDVAAVVESLLSQSQKEALTLSVDSRSNALLLAGDSAIRQTVLDLIKNLDQPISEGQSSRVVYLQYLRAAEAQSLLQGIAQTGAKPDDNAFTISASETTNALILSGSPAALDQLQAVLAKIDIRRAQVLVEAIIVEVSEDFTEQLGVEWSTNFANDNTLQALSNFNLSGLVVNGGQNLLTGSGLSLGFFRHGSLRALLRALASNGNANILSTPSLLTLDNQAAEILVGSNIPFITGQSTGNDGTENPFTTIERHDIGLSLKITPQVNQGSAITLDVEQQIENIVDSTAVSSDIITNKRSIKTRVIVDDDTTLVLGGLISDSKEELVRKVPFFGDIPLLGRLFRSTSTQQRKQNLMVFIHPTIIRNDQQAVEASQQRYREIQTLYQQSQQP